MAAIDPGSEERQLRSDSETRLPSPSDASWAR